MPNNPFGSILPAMKASVGDDTNKQDMSRTSNLSVAGSPKMPSYKKGVRKVPRTGFAKLHKGEAVLTVQQAKQFRRSKVSSAASSLGAGKKKVPNKSQRLIEAAGHEMKVNPPKVLRKTMRKSGAAQANKQRVAIMLSKARQAGASIPKR